MFSPDSKSIYRKANKSLYHRDSSLNALNLNNIFSLTLILILRPKYANITTWSAYLVEE